MDNNPSTQESKKKKKDGEDKKKKDGKEKESKDKEKKESKEKESKGKDKEKKKGGGTSNEILDKVHALCPSMLNKLLQNRAIPER